MYGISHTKLGRKFAERWGFPPSINVVIKNHHALKTTSLQSPLLYMIIVANCLLEERGFRMGFQEKADMLMEESLDRINLSRDQIEVVFRETRREWDGVSGSRQKTQSATACTT